MRVAAAFLASALVALAGLAVFVQVRMSEALEERLRDAITAEASRLEALPAPTRSAAVRALDGDVHAQVLSTEGRVLSSSRALAGPLLVPPPGDQIPRGTDAVYLEDSVTVLDDDAAAVGVREEEEEEALLLVRRSGEAFIVVAMSREDVDEALGQLRLQLLVGGPLALVVAAGLGYVAAGAGLRPIERLRERAATISDRRAGERLPVPSADDELRRLALTLNGMLARLDEGLQRERTFAAEAGHELRTPLTLMLTEIELALAGPRQADDLSQALASVQEEVRRLIVLSEDLLQRARPQEGDLPIESAPVDLVQLAERVADRFRTAAGTRAITVVAPRPVEVPGDDRLLDRALSNLVDNALRHGEGDVHVEVRASGDGADLTVVDDGPGFARGNGASSHGTGLGLAIVSEIVRAHGGSVEVSRLEDRTRVRVHLPEVRTRSLP